MASGNCTVLLPQMLDLALNVPECGQVNFNLLHAFLHVVVQQLELLQCKVEFRGKDGDRVQNIMKAVQSETTLKLTEFVVTPGEDAGKIVHRPARKDEAVDTVVLVEQTGELADQYEPCTISKKNMSDLNQELNSLKEKVQELADLPGNATLLDALKGAGIDKASPILDMFQLMTVSKRIEATEGGIEKLASMLEDLAKQSSLGATVIPGATTVGEALENVQERLLNIEHFLDGHGGGNFDSSAPASPGTSRPSKAGAGGSTIRPSGIGQGLSTTGPGEGGQWCVDMEIPDFTTMSQEEFAIAVRQELMKIKEEIKVIYDRLGMLFNIADEFSPNDIADAIRTLVRRHRNANVSGAVDNLPPGERLEYLEDRFNGTTEQIASLDSTFNQEIQNLHSQFADMEKAFGGIMEKIHFGMPGGDSPASGETLGELYEKLMSLQSEMENLAETAGKLIVDKEDKQRLLEVLTEQIEFLKTVKADKEDLEDALADKADACAINRKVSHDQFDTACDELSRGIEEALGKLTQQEELWQQALNEIQREIGNKLDRMELGPLRDFINNKLKMLQQRLKALTALKKETEAAGTKKFLRNVNCISCDKDVVMRKEMDSSLLPQPYALPPTRSMGPYLAYELDALRKQQKALPNSRNLNHFENALQQKTPRPGDDHICNRYCGGSHTITTPQQRVTRLGHFLNQWGPEAQGVCDSKGKEKDPSKLVVVGHAEEISKVESAERRESAKDAARKASFSQTQEKRSSEIPTEKRPSKGFKTTTPMASPKGSIDSNEKRRSSQRASATKRPSQISSKFGGAGQGEEKGASPISESKIPEETPSEVEKEEGSPPISPTSEAPAENAGATPRPSQIAARSSAPPSARPSLQGSARPSITTSARGSRMSAPNTARVSTSIPPAEETPAETVPAPGEQNPETEAPPPED